MKASLYLNDIFVMIIIKLLKFIFITFSLWLFVNSVSDVNIDPSIISDKLIQSAFYLGKKVQKVNYDEVQKGAYKIGIGKSMKITHRNHTDDSITKTYNYTNSAEFEEYESKINEERFDFTPYLYQIYGNISVFQMELADLEILVNKTVITSGQSLIFWETLLSRNNKREKTPNNNNYYNKVKEIYSFKVIPVKGSICIMITASISIFTYVIQTKMKYSVLFYLLFNLVLIQIVYHLMSYLYNIQFYMASSILSISICLSVKQLSELLFYNSGIKMSDVNIFSLSTEGNAKETTIKIFILLITNICMIYIATTFRYLLNYILAYYIFYISIMMICIPTILEVSYTFQPMRQLCNGIAGIVNLIIIHFHDITIRYSSNLKYDSLYVISNLFSLIVFYFFIDYNKIQSHNTSAYYYYYLIKKDTKNLEIPLKGKKTCHIDNILFLYPLLFFISVMVISLVFNDSLCFLVNLFTLTYIITVYNPLFYYNVSRFFNIFIIFISTLLNEINNKYVDNVLFEVNHL